MATQNDFTRAFGVNSAMSGFRRVALSSNGSVGYAATAVVGIGVLQQDVAGNSWDTPQVRFYTHGSFICSVTGVPVTIGDTLYAGATGQVASTGTVTIGLAGTNAATNGDIIEVYPLSGGLK